MDLTEKEVWEAIYVYFPAYKEVKDSGFDLNLQSAISAAQEQAFIALFEQRHCGELLTTQRIGANYMLYRVAYHIKEMGVRKFFEELK